MLEDIKRELHKQLYLDNQENEQIDEISLKKHLYLLIRECLKEREYEVSIGSYKINITPKNLSVKYENEQTKVEVSNEDVYYKTVRDTETRFFCISQMKKNEYLMDTPLIRVTGSVLNIDGISEEHYLFELYTDEEDSIRNYLNIPSDTEIDELNLDPDKAIMLKRKVNRTDTRTDVIDFFVNDKVVPVFLDTIIEKYKALPDRKEFEPSNYSNLIPTLDTKKKIVSYIYSSIVEFYSEYLKENN